MKKTFLFGFLLYAIGFASGGEASRATTLQDDGRGATYYRDGARFALEGRLEEAIAAFEHAIALDPKNGNIYYSLGNVYSELGRWEDAVAAYRKSISLNKNDVEAHNGLGIALARRGLNAQAAAAFERAISIYPKWAEPHFRLSQVYKSAGQEAESQAAYNRAIRLRPDYATSPPQTFMTAGLKGGVEPVGKKTSATGNAVADDNTRERTPAPTTVRTNDRARTNDDARTNGDAPIKASAPAPTLTTTRNETASKVSDLNTGDAKAYRDLGVRHGRAGRYEEAVAAFRQAILLDRNDADSYFALGNAYAELGRWRESVDAYEQAVRLDPKDGEAYERLGRSYAKLREASPRMGDGNDEAAIGARIAAPAGASADASSPREKSAPARIDSAPSNDTAGRGVAPSVTVAAPRVEAPAAARDAGVDLTTVYRVGPNDVLDISVPGGREPQTASYKVTSTGLLEYPSLSGPLQVGGLTTDEIASRLGAELNRRGIAATKPAVGVRDYVSHTIILSGLVKDPGTKILRREGVPLYVIIAHAQPSPEAGQALVVSRATGRSTAVDLQDTRALNMLVRPGDVVTVRVRPKQYFYIAGAIRVPGQKEFHTGLTLTQAILAAGGVTQSRASSVTIAREGSDGRLESNSFNLKAIGAGEVPDPALQPGDRIEVMP
ncbi:MAG TPA: tetratricopeptide repeat protein [Pyrinomonadaceae bacterium]|nr:tetratricopeptide repeat protein [Pyrinomonadaceae bacterium]